MPGNELEGGKGERCGRRGAQQVGDAASVEALYALGAVDLQRAHPVARSISASSQENTVLYALCPT